MTAVPGKVAFHPAIHELFYQYHHILTLCENGKMNMVEQPVNRFNNTVVLMTLRLQANVHPALLINSVIII